MPISPKTIHSTADFACIIARCCQVNYYGSGTTPSDVARFICKRFKSCLEGLKKPHGLVTVYRIGQECRINSYEFTTSDEAAEQASRLKAEVSSDDAPVAMSLVAAFYVDDLPLFQEDGAGTSAESSQRSDLIRALNDFEQVFQFTENRSQSATAIGEMATALRRASDNGTKFAIVGLRRQTAPISGEIEVKSLFATSDEQRNGFVEFLTSEGYRPIVLDVVPPVPTRVTDDAT